MSNANLFNWRRKPFAFRIPWSARKTNVDRNCACILETTQEIWERAPGFVLVVKDNGDAIWLSQKSRKRFGIEDVQSFSETFTKRLSEPDRNRFLANIRNQQHVDGCENDTFNLTAFAHHDRDRAIPLMVHTASFPGCERKGCSPKTIVTMFESANDAVLEMPTPDRTPNDHAGVHTLQAQAEAFLREHTQDAGEDLGAQRAETRLDLTYVLNAITKPKLASYKYGGTEFQLTGETDLPFVSGNPALLECFINELFEASQKLNPMAPAIHVALERQAASVRLTADSFGALQQVDCPQPRENEVFKPLIDSAERCGKFKRFQTKKDRISVQVAFPISARMVAPEPSREEHRIFHTETLTPCGALRNPIPRDQKTG